jgi:hypothetical protein
MLSLIQAATTQTPTIPLDQFVSGLAGVVVPFVAQLVRNHVLKLDGRMALLLSVGISLTVTAIGYVQLDATPTLGEFLANAGLCFATSQLVYNSLEKETVSGIASKATGLPDPHAPKDEEPLNK